MNAETEATPTIKRDLACLLALALGWRLLFLLGIPRVIDTADAIHYLEYARHLRNAEWLAVDPKIPLGYPALTALANVIITDIESAARAVSFAASLLLLVPVVLLANDLHGPRAARFAGLTLAIWPWFADYACRVSTEALAVTLWFSAVFFLLRIARDGGLGACAGAAVSLSGLYLTRPEGLFLCIAAIPACLLYTRGQMIRPLLSIVAAVVLVVVGNMFYVRTLTGATTPNYRVGFIVEEFNLLRFISTAFNTVTDVVPVMLGPVLLLFLGVGFFWPRKASSNLGAEFFLLYFALVQWAVTLPVLSPAPRYLMATILAFALWSARGMAVVTVAAAPKPMGGFMRQLPAAALIAVMFLGTATTIGGEYLGQRPRAPREYKEAGQWMQANLEPALIFTRKPQVAWYADMPSTGPALDDSLDEALARARDAAARYIVVDERYAPPGLHALLDPANTPDSLKLRYLNESYPQARIVVYELLAGEH